MGVGVTRVEREGLGKTGTEGDVGGSGGLQRIWMEGIGDQGEMNGVWENQRIQKGTLGECRGSWALERGRTRG